MDRHHEQSHRSTLERIATEWGVSTDVVEFLAVLNLDKQCYPLEGDLLAAANEMMARLGMPNPLPPWPSTPEALREHLKGHAQLLMREAV